MNRFGIIGFPYSGKSTLGKIILINIKKILLDIDKEIEINCMLNIEEILKYRINERLFRLIEINLINLFGSLVKLNLIFGGGGFNKIKNGSKLILFNLNLIFLISFIKVYETKLNINEYSKNRKIVNSFTLMKILRERDKYYRFYLIKINSNV